MFAYNFCILSTLLTISSAFLSQPNIARFAIPSQLVENTPAAPAYKLQSSSIHAATLSEGENSSLAESDDDDDEEYEMEEFEFLTESDFYGSEWKVGTVMENKKKIDETWCRLVVNDGKFMAIWGDNSEGTWNFDAASQFLSISKDTFGGWFGKKIWGGTVDDFYFIEGTVRGWSPISAAGVIGQWQCKRLGVDPDEAGIAPWFETDDEEEKAEGEDKPSESQTE